MIAATKIKTNFGTLPPLPPKYYIMRKNIDEMPVRYYLVPNNPKSIFLPINLLLY